MTSAPTRTLPSKSRLATAAIFALIFFAIGTAFAQQDDDAKSTNTSDNEPIAIDKISVTGSRIYAKGGESIAPVIIFTGEELQARGYTTLADFSRNLTLNLGAVSEFTGLAGSPSFNLRGLGVDATLMLLNGRRIALRPEFSDIGLDLNTFPLSVVDRVEVLKDGASAIYGADAVAGAVNIILKKDYLGTQFDALYRNTEEENASESQASLSFGRFLGRGSVWGFLSYHENNALARRDRDEFDSFDVRDQIGPLGDFRDITGRPGNYFIFGPNGIEFSWDPACANLSHPVGVYDPTTQPGPPLSFFFGGFVSEFRSEQMCAYDQGNDGTLMPRTERLSGYIGFDFPIANHSLFGSLYISDRKSHTEVGPTDVFLDQGGLFGLPIVSAEHPNNPFGLPVAVALKATDVGRRRISNDFLFYQALLGLRGNISDWNYELAVHLSEDRIDRLFENYIQTDPFLDALEGRGGPDGSSYYNPFFGMPNSPEVIDAFTIDFFEIYEQESIYLEGFVSRDLFEWRHGMSQLAIGLEYRDQTDRIVTDYGNIQAFEFAEVLEGRFSRDVFSAFAELTVPIYRDFDIQLAARFEDFSDFGSELSPKVGFRWKANDYLVLRGSFSEAFKAPTFNQLTAVPIIFERFYIDPIRCADPALSESAECLIGDRISASSFGNPELDSETAESFVFGLVFTPPGWNKLGIDIDYWQFDYSDRIDRPSLDSVREFFPDDPRFVVRAPPTEEDINAGRPGRVTDLKLPFINFETLEVRGLDAAVTWETEFRRLGNVTLDAQTTYYSHYEFKDSLANDPGNRVGTAVPFALPRWRSNFTATWEKGSNTVVLNANRTHSYRNASNTSDPNFKFDEWWTVDLQLQRTFIRWNSSKLKLACINCLDEPPPRNPFGLGSRAFYDLRGRQFLVSFSQPF